MLKGAEKPPIYNRFANGFSQCSDEEMISKLGFKYNLILDRKRYRFYSTNESFLVVDEGDGNYYELTLLTTNKKTVDAFEKFTETLEPRKDNTVNVLTRSMNGIEITPLESTDAPIIKDNYTPEIADKYNFLVEELQVKNPAGRLVIINGPPGSGKTYLIRGLIQEVNKATILVLPANLVSSMDGPELITTFIGHKRRYNNLPMILVIEDADSCLVPRMGDNISAISSMLNCADGILGSILDVRIIATTNQQKIQFDKALVRNGRMLKHLNIEELPCEQANKVYERLTGEHGTYSSPKLLADIYAETKGKTNNSAEFKDTAPIGFGARLVGETTGVPDRPILKEG